MATFECCRSQIENIHTGENFNYGPFKVNTMLPELKPSHIEYNAISMSVWLIFGRKLALTAVCWGDVGIKSTLITI